VSADADLEGRAIGRYSEDSPLPETEASQGSAEAGVIVPGRRVERAAVLDIGAGIQLQHGASRRRSGSATSEINAHSKPAARISLTHHRTSQLSRAITVLDPMTRIGRKDQIGRNASHPEGLIAARGLVS